MSRLPSTPQQPLEIGFQREDKDPFARSGADVGMRVQDLRAGNVADDLIEKRLRFFDEDRALS